MDTTELAAACRKVVDAGRGLEDRDGGADGSWGTALVVAHLVAANRNAAQLAAVVLAGAPSAPFTNRGALQRPYLEAIVRAAGGAEGTVAEFERSALELVDTCAPLDDAALATPIDASFWEADGPVFEGTVPLTRIFAIIQGHLEGHLPQLTGAGGRSEAGG